MAVQIREQGALDAHHSSAARNLRRPIHSLPASPRYIQEGFSIRTACHATDGSAAIRELRANDFFLPGGVLGGDPMKIGNRLRKRIDKAMRRDLRRQQERPNEAILNAFAFVMDMNRAILKTVSELTVELERIQRRKRRR